MDPYYHMDPHMKTTIELDDRLLIEAKALAARQRTTLRAVIERALRREIEPSAERLQEENSNLEVGPLGILRLKKAGSEMTPEAYRQLLHQIEAEDDARAFSSSGSVDPKPEVL